MVRLIRKVIGGTQVWVEVAPTACSRGHEGSLPPGRDACPECGEMVRVWRCRAVEDGQACGEVLVDDEHVHGRKRGE